MLIKSVIAACVVSAVLAQTTGRPHGTTIKPHGTTISKDDHLLIVLSAMHNSHTFKTLPASEQILLVEMLAAAEVNQITHFIDRVGFLRIVQFLDHVSSIDQAEAHVLEQYLMQELNQESIMTSLTKPSGHHRRMARSLNDLLNGLMTMHIYYTLSPQDQQLLKDLFIASQNHNVTKVIEQNGYASIIGLVEHMTTLEDTHKFLHFLSKNIQAEMSGQNQPALG